MTDVFLHDAQIFNGSGITFQDIDLGTPPFLNGTNASLTASTALIADSGKAIISSSTTSTELGYVHGVTSAIQTQFTNLSSTYLTLTGGTLSGAVGIGGAATPSTLLSLTSTTQGFLPPQMSTTNQNGISSPAEGLIVYNTTSHTVNFWNGSVWKVIATV